MHSSTTNDTDGSAGDIVAKTLNPELSDTVRSSDRFYHRGALLGLIRYQELHGHPTPTQFWGVSPLLLVVLAWRRTLGIIGGLEPESISKVQ
jgi:hypothetical protein